MIPAANNLIENRQIRVFISSTFRDMQAERDYLMTRVFPLLRRKAARRDVSLVELDLRWGITEEESKSGRVVQICLNEIDNSRPFFIGLLGDRYGWCPDRRELGKDTLLEERYPWLGEELQRGVSITEIEMQYGVLRSPEPVNAYFFLKKAATNRTNGFAGSKTRSGTTRAIPMRNTGTRSNWAGRSRGPSTSCSTGSFRRVSSHRWRRNVWRSGLSSEAAAEPMSATKKISRPSIHFCTTTAASFSSRDRAAWAKAR